RWLLVHVAGDALGRPDQNDTQTNLQRTGRDESHKEGTHDCSDDRSDSHRDDGRGEWGAIGIRPSTTVKGDASQYRGQAHQQAGCASGLDINAEGEHQRGDDDLATGYTEHAA